MTGAEIATSVEARDAQAADPVQRIRGLLADSAELVRRLRGVQIPQHLGMAAACRALAAELPRALAAQVEADLKTGALAERWDVIRAMPSELAAGGDVDPTTAGLAMLLRDQGRVAMRHLLLREKEWVADAHRLEGHAGALEMLVDRLRRILTDAATPEDANAGSGAREIAAAAPDAAAAAGTAAAER